MDSIHEKEKESNHVVPKVPKILENRDDPWTIVVPPNIEEMWLLWSIVGYSRDIF